MMRICGCFPFYCIFGSRWCCECSTFGDTLECACQNANRLLSKATKRLLLRNALLHFREALGQFPHIYSLTLSLLCHCKDHTISCIVADLKRLLSPPLACLFSTLLSFLTFALHVVHIDQAEAFRHDFPEFG